MKNHMILECSQLTQLKLPNANFQILNNNNNNNSNNSNNNNSNNNINNYQPNSNNCKNSKLLRATINKIILFQIKSNPKVQHKIAASMTYHQLCPTNKVLIILLKILF